MNKVAHILEFIVGTTAVGKTEYALARARETGAVILNADALCVYRGMDIGTAKPTLEEMSRVPHYGIDLVPVRESFSVGDYLSYVHEFLAERKREGRPVVVVGGSGFYLKSFFAPVADRLEIPDSVSREVSDLEQEEGLAGLRRRLEAVNRGEVLKIDLQNPRRVSKALMRCLASNKTLSQLQSDFEQLPAPFPDWTKRVVLLERPREELEERNRRRVDAMLEAGLIEEVQRLQAEGLENNPSAASAIGYRETLAVLRGELEVSALAERIFINTRQLMRKQRTWFRHQIPVHERVAL